MKKTPTHNTEQFLTLIAHLKQLGNPYATIARRIGIRPQKISDIKAKRSSANKEIVEALYRAYPELSQNRSSNTIAMEEQIKLNFKLELEKLTHQVLHNNAEYLRNLEKRIKTIETRLDQIFELMQEKN